MSLSKPANSTAQSVTQLLFNITSDGSLRGLITSDNCETFSIYDFITKLFKKDDSGTYARQLWGRMQKPNYEHYNEVVTLVTICHNLVLPGSGGRKTPCTGIRGLQQLLTILSSKVSEDYRTLLNETLLRYVAGDRSMIIEIEENAASEAPINVLARDALAREPLIADAQQQPLPQSTEDERMDLVRGISTDLKTMLPVMQQQQATIAQHVNFLVAMQNNHDADRTRLLADVTRSNTERDHERHLRHQADGRLGSEVRDANKRVREEACMWRDAAERAEKRMRHEQDRCDEKDRLILKLVERLTATHP